METNEFTSSVIVDDVCQVRPSISEKLTYSVAEAASILGVSRPSIYRLMARRVLIPIPGLRNKRLPKKQVRRLADVNPDFAREA
jgi:excisionase family DNA binding protein